MIRLFLFTVCALFISTIVFAENHGKREWAYYHSEPANEIIGVYFDSGLIEHRNTMRYIVSFVFEELKKSDKNFILVKNKDDARPVKKHYLTFFITSAGLQFLFINKQYIDSGIISEKDLNDISLKISKMILGTRLIYKRK